MHCLVYLFFVYFMKLKLSEWALMTEQEREHIIDKLIIESTQLSPKLRSWLILYHWIFCFELVYIE